MQALFEYPIFMRVSEGSCLIAGFGPVGRRKLDMLLKSGAASVLVLDPKSLAELGSEAAALVAQPGVEFAQRCFRPEDSENRLLVFAATGNSQENSRIAAICRKAHVLCNCVTNPQEGSFIVPATARSGNLGLALSTCGASPLMARLWRDELQKWLETKNRLAWLMGKLRPLALASASSQQAHKEFFMSVVSSGLPQWLEAADLPKCRSWLMQRLPSVPETTIDRILAEYKDAFPC